MESRVFQGQSIGTPGTGFVVPQVPFTLDQDPLSYNMINNNEIDEFRSRVSEFAEGIVGGVVTTKGLFTMGIHKLCEINAKFMTSIRDSTMQCAASFSTRNKEPQVIQRLLDSINEYLYTRLDGNYVLVLDCNELVDEAQTLDSGTYNEYLGYCARFNLITASTDMEILSQIQNAFLTYQRSMNPALTAENYNAPNNQAVILFLIELMFTPSGPSYTTSADEASVMNFYRRVTSDRRKINKAALKAQTSITWNRDGNLVTIKPKYIGTARQGQAYPTQPGSVIQNDYPQLGSYREQKILHLREKIAKAEKKLVQQGVLPSQPYERSLAIRTARNNMRRNARIMEGQQTRKASRGSAFETNRSEWAQDDIEEPAEDVTLVDSQESRDSQDSQRGNLSGGKRKTAKKGRVHRKNKGRKTMRKSIKTGTSHRRTRK